jgi:hypothetical protein
MNEVFPFVSGLIVGALLGYLRPQTRLLVGALAAVVLGFAATVVSGEYRVSWEFLLIDIPLVALASTASFLVLRTIRRRQLAGRGPAQS